MQKKLGSLIKSTQTSYTRHRALTGKTASIRDICKSGVAFAKPVTLPLILISQIQRSGGTLLSQLFDGHPECYAHPHELKIGNKSKERWPTIDQKEPAGKIFKKLFEMPHAYFAANGYTKGKENDKFPFYFVPRLQKEIFIHYMNTYNHEKKRDVYNAYFTSYFNAWLDLQYKYADKKIITAFVAGMNSHRESMREFFDIYPDGMLISIIRNPMDWFASAKNHKSKKERFGEVETGMRWWNNSAQSMVDNKAAFGDRVILINFENLINDTEGVMKYLAGRLGIIFDKILLIPTFNSMPIKANSSFSVEAQGVIGDVTKRKDQLNSSEKKYIEKYMDQYQRVLNIASV